jgi:FkbM family methyltransferase
MNNVFLRTGILLILGIFFTMSSKYFSQPCTQQDKYLNERYFKDKRKGVFVDIGAHDGISYSNTYFFEKELGWSGICIEPLPSVFELLKKNRNCVCINACISQSKGIVDFIEVKGSAEMLSGMVSTYHPKHLERLKEEIQRDGGSYSVIRVQSDPLGDILDKYHIENIDYLSLDTEGGEFDILNSIDFTKCMIQAISVENNYGDVRIKALLGSKGFYLVDVLSNFDEIYINERSNLFRRACD